jgi:hypothetical protein
MGGAGRSAITGIVAETTGEEGGGGRTAAGETRIKKSKIVPIAIGIKSKAWHSLNVIKILSIRFQDEFPGNSLYLIYHDGEIRRISKIGSFYSQMLQISQYLIPGQPIIFD